jgi:hypothetical protein
MIAMAATVLLLSLNCLPSLVMVVVFVAADALTA